MNPTVLMVQGTTSDAGKTILVAGLCRVLARQGVRVAPFKPQNMALNSAVTLEGGEIGRAQALQAQACFLEPSNDMNPILMKPEKDASAQIVIHGKAASTMDARSYHLFKAKAMDYVLESYERLAQQYDVIVVEGAGSPAEINLRDNDIANMGFAEAVDCRVILVADIDRGGVFAHLVGTLELLADSERERVCGMVINKFRGDIELLLPGNEWLENKVQKPVIGVLPYLQNFYLDAEDAISQQQRLNSAAKTLKVAVIVLPRISNHTDFDALRLHEQVDLMFVAPSADIPACDLIILPGSKNVRADLQQLINSGQAEAVKTHLRYGGKVMGICGGYQMLGQEVCDPGGVEDDAGNSEGLRLIAMSTTLTVAKKLQRRQGVLRLGDVEISGYEIHCGVSSGMGLETALIHYEDGSGDGAISPDGNVIGCYLHGLFDDPPALQSLLDWAGLKDCQGVDVNALREEQLERLADVLTENLDLGLLFPEFFSSSMELSRG